MKKLNVTDSTYLIYYDTGDWNLISLLLRKEAKLNSDVKGSFLSMKIVWSLIGGLKTEVLWFWFLKLSGINGYPYRSDCVHIVSLIVKSQISRWCFQPIWLTAAASDNASSSFIVEYFEILTTYRNSLGDKSTNPCHETPYSVIYHSNRIY